jgi:glycerophosphoryl diester phosphodiesterase
VRYGFAHRGGAPGPDNTLVAFAAALAAGANGLETDAWLSQDGAVILDHDGTVPGPDGRKPIAQVRRDELPAHIATLDELYDRCGTNFTLAIDVKTEPVAAAIVAVARRFDATDRLWLVEASTTAQDALEPSGAHRAITVRGNVLRSRRRTEILAHAKSIGVEAINARWPWWSSTLVDQAHDRGLLAFGYDAQRRFALNRCVDLGLDAVFSNHVDRLLTAQARSQAKSKSKDA